MEFGCGPTTELIGLLGRAYGRMEVTTIEHDPWAANELLSLIGPFVTNYRWYSFYLCPLVLRRCFGTPRPVYDDGMGVPMVPHPADLVLINGPPNELGGRGGTMYQALKYAGTGTIILLLDVRDNEQGMLTAWLSDLESSIAFLPPGLLNRHLAFVVHEPVSVLLTLEQPFAQEQAVVDVATP